MSIRSASPSPDYPALLERAQPRLRRDPELRAARAGPPTHDGCVPDDGIGRYPRTARDHDVGPDPCSRADPGPVLRPRARAEVHVRGDDDVLPDDHVVIQPAPRADPRAVSYTHLTLPTKRIV